MKPTEVKKPSLICVKPFIFTDADACEYKCEVGMTVDVWFWDNWAECYQLAITDVDSDCYCMQSPEEIDDHFDVILD